MNRQHIAYFKNKNKGRRTKYQYDDPIQFLQVCNTPFLKYRTSFSITPRQIPSPGLIYLRIFMATPHNNPDQKS